MTGNGSKTVRVYDVRAHEDMAPFPVRKGQWLGRVVIMDDGYFSAVSEYGNYAFWWGAAGDCFRRFLCQIDPDYLCNKLGSREYDGAETEKAIKRHIRELRRRLTLSRDEARDEMAILERHEDLLESLDGFHEWIRESKLEDTYELARHDFPVSLKAFSERLLPALKAMLRAEIEAEAPAVAPKAVPA
jgi:hypothetical protein